MFKAKWHHLLAGDGTVVESLQLFLPLGCLR